MGQNPHNYPHGPDPVNPNYPPQSDQRNPNYAPPPGNAQAQNRAGQPSPAQAYPGYQPNLAAMQGYPGYQRSFDALAPVLPEIQLSHFAGYNQQPVAPLILPPPQPSRPRRGRAITILITFIALVLIAGGGTGFFFYNNHQNTIHAQATAISKSRARASATAHILATATAIASTYPFSKHLVLNDPLTDPGHASQYGWTNNASCFFAQNAYHAYANQSTPFTLCAATQTHFDNFTYQVQMTIQQGDTTTSGGLAFRAQSGTSELYLLAVNIQGSYRLSIAPGTKPISTGQVATFVPGLNQKNTLAVVVRGQKIAFYSNQKLVATITDASFTSGQIGVVSSYGSSPANVAYTNAQVWQL